MLGLGDGTRLSSVLVISLVEVNQASISLVYWHERWFRKRVSGKLKWPLFSSVNFLLLLSPVITFLPEGKVLRY